MTARLSLPVHVDNDANLGALSEFLWGAGSTATNLAYLKVATGIGAGLIVVDLRLPHAPGVDQLLDPFPALLDGADDAEPVDDIIGHEVGVGRAPLGVLRIVIVVARLDVVGQRPRHRAILAADSFRA